MSNDRDPHPPLRARSFVRHASLAGTLALAVSSGLPSWAQTSSLPNVNAGSPTESAGRPAVGSTAAPATSGSSTAVPRTVPSAKSSAPVIDEAVRRPTASTAPATSNERNNGQVAANQAAKTASNSARFFCQMWKGQYTVMYSPEKRTSESYPWAVPKDLGGGWIAERRCNEISRRLEEYRPDGLQELSTATENGYNTVCATTQSKPACRIVFTVPPGQDPITTRNSVFESLATADDGKMTQGVNTFVGTGGGNLNLNGDLVNMGLAILGSGSGLNRNAERSAINLKPFLDPTDGGTGIEMNNGVRLQKGIRLNPERFR
jgi:Circadian oscillating protein COP23